MLDPAEKKASPLNVTDLVLGCVLLLLIPLVTAVYLKNAAQEAAAGQQPAPAAAPPDTILIEMEDEQKELDRIYRDSAQFFMARMRSQENGQYRTEEAAWARANLNRCREGYMRLLTRARAPSAPAELSARSGQLERWVRRIEDDLRALAAEEKASPAASSAGVEVDTSAGVQADTGGEAPVVGTGVDGEPVRDPSGGEGSG